MNAITVTREYGAGGYEVAGRLAEVLGWELLDRELLHRAALVEQLPDADLERLDEQAIGLADRLRLHPPHQQYIHGLREAALQAAARGKVVLVGRGTGQLLADQPDVLHLRLVADREWRAQRMARKEGWSLEDARNRCISQDRTRDRFTRYFFGSAPGQPASYHLVFNTGWVPLEEVVACTAALVRSDVGETVALPDALCPGVLTLSRELGAGEMSFVAALASRLGLHAWDRELLEQEAIRLGVTETELAQVDEHAAGFLQRFLPGNLFRRYFDTLGRLMKELAVRGDVLLVGRGGNHLLRGQAGAFHARLVAPMAERVRRVMEHRWVREEVARQLIAGSDSQRLRFIKSCFTGDWASPLEYHLVVNSNLGLAALDLVALAARRHWTHL